MQACFRSGLPRQNTHKLLFAGLAVRHRPRPRGVAIADHVYTTRLFAEKLEGLYAACRRDRFVPLQQHLCFRAASSRRPDFDQCPAALADVTQRAAGSKRQHMAVRGLCFRFL